MIRETRKAGREEDILSLDQARAIIATPDIVPHESHYVGYFDDTDGKIHRRRDVPILLPNEEESHVLSFQPDCAHYWIRESTASGIHLFKSIKVDDIRSLDVNSSAYAYARDQRAYSSVHGIMSGLQVRLVKKEV